MEQPKTIVKKSQSTGYGSTDSNANTKQKKTVIFKGTSTQPSIELQESHGSILTNENNSKDYDDLALDWQLIIESRPQRPQSVDLSDRSPSEKRNLKSITNSLVVEEDPTPERKSSEIVRPSSARNNPLSNSRSKGERIIDTEELEVVSDLGRKSSDSFFNRSKFRKEKKKSSIFSSPFKLFRSSKNKLRNSDEGRNENADVININGMSISQENNNNNNNNVNNKEPNAIDKIKEDILKEFEGGDEPSPRTRKSTALLKESLKGRSFAAGFRDEAHYSCTLDEMTIKTTVEQHFTWQTVKIPSLGNRNVPLSQECIEMLKFLIRKGIPDAYRTQVWRTTSGCLEFSMKNPSFYSEVLNRVFGEHVPKDILKIPTFGGVFNPKDHYLTVEGVLAAKRILCAVAMEHPSIQHLPMLPDLVMLLLNFLTESDCYVSIYLMLKLHPDTATTPKRNPFASSSSQPVYGAHPHSKFGNGATFFTPSRKGVKLLLANFEDLVNKNLGPIRNLMKKLDVDIRYFANDWFLRLFVTVLPYHTVLRFFDSFLCEGVKILYRVSLGFLKFCQKTYMSNLEKCATKEEFHTVIQHIAHQMIDADTLMKYSFSIRMRDQHVERFSRKNVRMLRETSDENLRASSGIYYRPRISTPSKIIAEEQFEILWDWLPSRYCIRDPVLLYSTDDQGFSMNRFLSILEDRSPTLIIMATTKQEVFGAFASHPWKKEKSYYGDRECFLWKLGPHPEKFGWRSGNTDYFMLVTNSSMQVGGGEGVGLWLDSELWKGRTQKCSSFDNKPLTSDGREDFECARIEVYGFA